ncbi:MAG: hypothetical protein HYY13_13580 [Nitrospirae bacterium]|nr:hypothetical protein [Nitrospirota bacterium]
MKSSVLIILSSLAGVSPSVARGEPMQSDEDRSWAFARELYAEGHLDEAVLEFRRFGAYYPASARAPWSKLLAGIALTQQGRAEDARDEFRTLTEGGGAGLQERARLEEAKTYYFERRWNDAERGFSGFLAPGASSDREVASEAVFYLGWIRLNQDSGSRAASVFAAMPDEAQLAKYRDDLVRVSHELQGRQKKSPVTAGLLAALLPGAGHVYLGRWADAGTSLVLNALFGLATYEAFRRQLYLVGGAAAFFEVTWYSGNIFGAVSGAHESNERDKRLLLDGLAISPGREPVPIPR